MHFPFLNSTFNDIFAPANHFSLYCKTGIQWNLDLTKRQETRFCSIHFLKCMKERAGEYRSLNRGSSVIHLSVIRFDGFWLQAIALKTCQSLLELNIFLLNVYLSLQSKCVNEFMFEIRAPAAVQITTSAGK